MFGKISAALLGCLSSLLLAAVLQPTISRSFKCPIGTYHNGDSTGMCDTCPTLQQCYSADPKWSSQCEQSIIKGGCWKYWQKQVNACTEAPAVEPTVSPANCSINKTAAPPCNCSAEILPCHSAKNSVTEGAAETATNNTVTGQAQSDVGSTEVPVIVYKLIAVAGVLACGYLPMSIVIIYLAWQLKNNRRYGPVGDEESNTAVKLCKSQKTSEAALTDDFDHADADKTDSVSIDIAAINTRPEQQQQPSSSPRTSRRCEHYPELINLDQPQKPEVHLQFLRSLSAPADSDVCVTKF